MDQRADDEKDRAFEVVMISDYRVRIHKNYQENHLVDDVSTVLWNLVLLTLSF